MAKAAFTRRVFPALLFFSIVLIILSCISKNPEQPETVTPGPDVLDKTGAFQPIPPDSAAAQRAYLVLRDDLAVQKPSFVLGPVLKAESQVVAGVNIRLYCEYRESAGESVKILRAKVFINLKDEASLVELDLDVKAP